MEVDSRPPWERGQQAQSAPQAQILNTPKKKGNPFKFLSFLKLSKKKSGVAAVAAVFIIMAAAGAFLYLNKNGNSVLGTASDPGQTPQALAEAVDLISKVSKLTELPDETPTIATVSDVTKLQSQSFFARAQNGDKVLVYEQAKKAILYRPATNKIIEIAPLSIPTQAATPSATIEPIVTSEPTSVPTQAVTPTPSL